MLTNIAFNALDIFFIIFFQHICKDKWAHTFRFESKIRNFLLTQGEKSQL